MTVGDPVTEGTVPGGREARGDTKLEVQLDGVQQTLLIPLYGRAVETGKRRPLLRDPRAAQIVASIDYDFRPFARKPGLWGTVVRTAMLDVWARRFLAEHPAGTVVELGTGLNTRFERLDNGTVHWFDLDLPDVIAMRRRFFTDTDRRHMICASVLDPAWVEVVRTSPGPYLFLAEAVLMYLEGAQVVQVLTLIAHHFPGSWLALDAGAQLMADAMERRKVLRTMGARMRWVCPDPTDLERLDLGLRLRESRTLAEPPAELRARMRPTSRVWMSVLAALFRRQVNSYRLNLFQVGG